MLNCALNVGTTNLKKAVEQNTSVIIRFDIIVLVPIEMCCFAENPCPA